MDRPAWSLRNRQPPRTGGWWTWHRSCLNIKGGGALSIAPRLQVVPGSDPHKQIFATGTSQGVQDTESCLLTHLSAAAGRVASSRRGHLVHREAEAASVLGHTGRQTRRSPSVVSSISPPLGITSCVCLIQFSPFWPFGGSETTPKPTSRAVGIGSEFNNLTVSKLGMDHSDDVA